MKEPEGLLGVKGGLSLRANKKNEDLCSTSIRNNLPTVYLSLEVTLPSVG